MKKILGWTILCRRKCLKMVSLTAAKKAEMLYLMTILFSHSGKLLEIQINIRLKEKYMLLLLLNSITLLLCLLERKEAERNPLDITSTERKYLSEEKPHMAY